MTKHVEIEISDESKTDVDAGEDHCCCCCCGTTWEVMKTEATEAEASVPNPSLSGNDCRAHKQGLALLLPAARFSLSAISHRLGESASHYLSSAQQPEVGPYPGSDASHVRRKGWVRWRGGGEGIAAEGKEGRRVYE